MITIKMATISEFDSSSKLNEYLAKQLNEGKLALFLGAGVSQDFGLPGWQELLNRLYSEKGETPPTGKSEKQQADLFKIKHYTNNDKGYMDAIKTALYSSVKLDFAELRKNDLLAAIASIVMASNRGGASEVITLNYDDVLETYLDYHGYYTNSVCSELFWKKQADVTIYHPHGFIPFRLGYECSKEIILDQLSYSRVVGNSANPWRQQILSIMRTHTCIFIGLSGSDDNLDSLLVECKDQHASKSESTLFWGLAFAKGDDKDTKALWESRGVFCSGVNDYKADISAFLFNICQMAAKIRNEKSN